MTLKKNCVEEQKRGYNSFFSAADKVRKNAFREKKL